MFFSLFCPCKLWYSTWERDCFCFNLLNVYEIKIKKHLDQFRFGEACQAEATPSFVLSKLIGRIRTEASFKLVSDSQITQNKCFTGFTKTKSIISNTSLFVLFLFCCLIVVSIYLYLYFSMGLGHTFILGAKSRDRVLCGSEMHLDKDSPFKGFKS